MRKHIISPGQHDVSLDNPQWLNLETLADVEVTSEDPAHPIESALLPESRAGWKAEQTGPQTVRLLFHEPQRIKRVQLVFHEHECSRTQQFVLRWSSSADGSYHEIVRQQYNFSPPGTISEYEDYIVEIAGLTTLELNITPDIGGGSARASLSKLRLA
jgi:hypothetical protein